MREALAGYSQAQGGERRRRETELVSIPGVGIRVTRALDTVTSRGQAQIPAHGTDTETGSSISRTETTVFINSYDCPCPLTDCTQTLARSQET